ANVGLGYACAERLAELKPTWTIVLACRDRNKADAAAGRIKSGAGNPNIVTMDLDLASLVSVRKFAQEFSAAGLPPLRALVCNAGVQFASETSYVDGGIETTFAVNHLGHFLLTNLLLRQLAPSARIVFVASGTHDPKKKTGIPHPRYPSALRVAKPETDPDHAKDNTATAGKRRYSTSKLCNVYCTYEMARRLDALGTPITVTAFDPGLIPGTDLVRDYNPVLRFLWYNVLPRLTFLPGNIHSIRHSGHALADLAVDPKFDGITGKYFEGRTEIPSSELSYIQDNWTDLWTTSVELAGLGPDDTPLPLA
ncbi:MAG: SDR family NAD(P)-dependent oxidoreductase, partial [Rhodospirillales bacterium]|nr:SDR family NAD(P)-dependent oxidoreductase [Rhodospirillales bacterium]